MTELLYYTDAYLIAFTARVESVDGVRVRLDRTAFYPTSGGQLFDTGTLGGAKVRDVVDEEAGIVHVLDSAPSFANGAEVKGAVDWPRRFDHMQQHTGQHLLSALFEEMAGARTESVHFGDEYSTIDVNAESLSRVMAARIEARANVVVSENRAVTVSFEDAAAAEGLRKASDRSGDIRIVSIDGIDRSACGGTHVRATGEIGAVLVRKLEKYKKLTRVEFLCGARATARARADYDALSGIAAGLSAGIDELPTLIASQKEAIHSLESLQRALSAEVAEYRAKDFYAKSTPDAAGIRRLVNHGASVDDIRSLATALSALSKTIFVGTSKSPLTIVFATSHDSGVHAGDVLKAALAANGGRGGGNVKIAQGTVPTGEALAAVVQALIAS